MRGGTLGSNSITLLRSVDRVAHTDSLSQKMISKLEEPSLWMDRTVLRFFIRR